MYLRNNNFFCKGGFIKDLIGTYFLFHLGLIFCNIKSIETVLVLIDIEHHNIHNLFYLFKAVF